MLVASLCLARKNGVPRGKIIPVVSSSVLSLRSVSTNAFKRGKKGKSSEAEVEPKQMPAAADPPVGNIKTSTQDTEVLMLPGKTNNLLGFYVKHKVKLLIGG